MEKELRILMIEDVPTDAELEMRELKRAGLRVVHRLVDTEGAFREALREFEPEIILSDFSMPHFDGMSALALVRELAPDVPFIFVSGTIGEEYAIRALKNGATDYVLKNNLLRLPAAVERALQDAQERLALQRAQEALRVTEERFRSFMRHLPGRASIRDAEGRYTFVNEFWLRAFGMDPAAVLGRKYDEIWPSDRVDDLKSTHLKVLETNKPASRVFRTGADDNIRWWLSTHFPIPGPQGNAALVGTVAIDVTEQKIQEAKITRLSRIHAVLSGINSAIVRIRDRQELFEEACRIAVEHGKFTMSWIGMLDEAAQAIRPVARMGREEGYLERLNLTIGPNNTGNLDMAVEAVGRRAPVVCNDIATDGRMRPWRAAALERGYRSSALFPLMLEQRAVGVFVLYAPEPGFFDEEELKLLTELAGDISFSLEHIGKEEKLNYLAYYDVLTGLPNRALFNDRLEQRVSAAQHDRKTFAVLMLDLERFRNINETLGRTAGDDLLRQVGQRLKNVLEETDILAHFGGDHFAIATQLVDEGGNVAHFLEKILTTVLGPPFEAGGNELRLAARAGVVVYPEDGTGTESLLRNAEAALNKAKASGERYVFYQPKMNAAVAQTLLLENRLRQALEKEQFVLHYQPKVDLAQGTLIGLEALIRWNDPATGLVPPMRFIPLLEETGMILEVGRWAIRKALEDYREWRARGLQPPRIAVNVSPIQLRQKNFVDVVRDAIGESPAGSHGLDLEVTESQIMEDIEGNIEKLRAVMDMGVNIAIDDFGTGYSSLGYLAKLPVNALKIDRSFIITMANNADSMTIVSTIISLAHALNLKVIAEGVDSEEQRKLLKLLKCDEMQGYLFSKPLPAAEIEAKFLAAAAA